MKKVKLITIMIFASLKLAAQTPVVRADFNVSILNLNALITTVNTSDSLILTNNALNYYFARKVASYLSVDGDLSLYKNYAIANIDEGMIYFGHNFNFRQNETDRIKNILTTGIKAKADDKFSELFSDSKFNGHIGIDLKYTRLGAGTVWFDTKKQEQRNKSRHVFGSQQLLMNARRTVIYNNLISQLDRRINEFNTGSIGISNTEYSPLKAKFIQDNSDNLITDFTEQEVNEFDNEVNSHNASRVSWISLNAFVPLTKTEYKTSNSLMQNFDTKLFRPFEGGINWVTVMEHKSRGTLFLNFKVGALLNNNIKTGLMNEMDINTYKEFRKNDTITLAKLSDDKKYVGNYETFLTSKIQLQMVYFLPTISWIGISILGEKFFGKYAPVNYQLGFPIVLQGKDEDSKVNLELQFKAFDFYHSVKPNNSFKDKFSVGISIGLPFSSIIY